MQAVSDGVIDRDKVDDLLLIAAVWVDPGATDEEAVYENNLAATSLALAAGKRAEPALDRGDRGRYQSVQPFLSVRLRPIRARR